MKIQTPHGRRKEKLNENSTDDLKRATIITLANLNEFEYRNEFVSN